MPADQLPNYARFALYRRMSRKRSRDVNWKSVASRLSLTRSVVGLNQGEFGKRAGLAPNQYNQYETGAKKLSITGAVALCNTYNLTLDWLFLDDPSGLPYEMGEAIAALRTARSDA